MFPSHRLQVQRRHSALHHTSHHYYMIVAVLLCLQHTPRPPQHLIHHRLDIHLLACAIQHFAIRHITICYDPGQFTFFFATGTRMVT